MVVKKHSGCNVTRTLDLLSKYGQDTRLYLVLWLVQLCFLGLMIHHEDSNP